MPDGSFVVVAIIAVMAPLLRELAPRILVPAIVLELVGGIIVGPHLLGIAGTTESVELFAQIGLAALLFARSRSTSCEAGCSSARWPDLRSPSCWRLRSASSCTTSGWSRRLFWWR